MSTRGLPKLDRYKAVNELFTGIVEEVITIETHRSSDRRAVDERLAVVETQSVSDHNALDEHLSGLERQRVSDRVALPSVEVGPENIVT